MERPFWYIIANPAAANGAAGRRWPRIEALLQEMGVSYTVRFTDARGHAVRLVDDAVLKGHRHILGLGGDGTNHEIVNGIMRQRHAATADIAYALLPIGTGNDWARSYGIPRDPRTRLGRLLELKTVLQDVGNVQYHTGGQTAGRYFANVAGMAYDAFIAKKLDRHRFVSRLQYLLMVGQYLFEYRPVPACLRFNGQTVEDVFYTINIGICRYSGGGMQLVPHAVPDDGLLALTYARRLPKWEVLAQTRRFYNGTILSHPKIGNSQVRHLLVEHTGDTPTLLEADGEFLGETPATFSIADKALRVVL
ncbi:MAG: diacylglycerol kinase family lipid kinase [Saprospirales bacterium]|jgi:diacylglycerol kinase (ATP)|nr:diacylglycerol kinase family lipid kinase [Saprospirales bacterium]MBK8924181.1 diacylglycerol kinase family lipid kinase [Saprospirales bacterium]